MKKSDKERMEWARKYVGEEKIREIVKMSLAGIEFELQFFKDPFAFCAAHEFTVYMGFGKDIELGKTYVFVHQKGEDAFVILWIYPNGHAPGYVMGENSIRNLKDKYDFSFVDNEIFLLWLNENRDLIHNIYENFKKEHKKIQRLKKISPPLD